jgi:hypothetical protein
VPIVGDQQQVAPAVPSVVHEIVAPQSLQNAVMELPPTQMPNASLKLNHATPALAPGQMFIFDRLQLAVEEYRESKRALKGLDWFERHQAESAIKERFERIVRFLAK